MAGGHVRCDELFIGLAWGQPQVRRTRRAGVSADALRRSTVCVNERYAAVAERNAIVKPSSRPVNRSSLQFARLISPMNLSIDSFCLSPVDGKCAA